MKKKTTNEEVDEEDENQKKPIGGKHDKKIPRKRPIVEHLKRIFQRRGRISVGDGKHDFKKPIMVPEEKRPENNLTLLNRTWP